MGPFKALWKGFSWADSQHGSYNAALLSVIIQCSVVVMTTVAFPFIMRIMGLAGLSDVYPLP